MSFNFSGAGRIFKETLSKFYSAIDNDVTCNFRLGIIAHETDHIEPRRFEVLSDGHTVAAGGAGNEDALDRHGLTEIPSATT